MIDGSPWSRCWSIALNQFQQRDGIGLLRLGRIDHQAAAVPRPAAFICVPVAKSSGSWVQPCSITSSGTGCAGVGARHVQLVAAGAGRVGVAAVDELAGQARSRASRRRHLVRQVEWVASSPGRRQARAGALDRRRPCGRGPGAARTLVHRRCLNASAAGRPGRLCACLARVAARIGANSLWLNFIGLIALARLGCAVKAVVESALIGSRGSWRPARAPDPACS